MIAWNDLLAALGLLLVLEGIMPFLNPAALRRALETMITLNDRQFRVAGLISMGLGLLILYFFKGSS
jgi:uncharacterized protein YjeT (DUF2065 family)